MKIDFSLYFIADVAKAGSGRSFLGIIEQSLAGGVSIVQLRAKRLSTREFFDLAKEVKRITDKRKIPLIINDRVDIAMAAGAAGVHLGQDDMPLSMARKLLGKKKIIGTSVHTVAEAQRAERDGADYIGAGTVFPTISKQDIRGIIEPGGLNKICKKVAVPTLAIGGVSLSNVADVMRSGAAGIAVISAISDSNNPKRTSEQLKAIIHSFNQ
jgi:thiamine-phosphate pyrophosphorylase